MNKTYRLGTSMIVRSLDVNKDPFHPYEDDEELFGLEVPYISVVGVLMCLAHHTRLGIAYVVSLSVRFSSSQCN